MNSGEDLSSSAELEARQFCTTHWSLVRAAGDGRSPAAQEALEKLCRAYWYPLYAFVRASGRGHHEAQDLVQGFFARLLERRDLDAAQPERGRFRSFLITDLKFFVANEWQKETAKKRGAGRILSWDALLENADDRFRHEPADRDSPEKIYTQSWILNLVERSAGMLEADFAQKGQADRFRILKEFLPGKNPDLSQADAAKQLGISEGAFGKAVFDLRKRLREVLREEIAQTCATYEDFEAELRLVLAEWSR